MERLREVIRALCWTYCSHDYGVRVFHSTICCGERGTSLIPWRRRVKYQVPVCWRREVKKCCRWTEIRDQGPDDSPREAAYTLDEAFYPIMYVENVKRDDTLWLPFLPLNYGLAFLGYIHTPWHHFAEHETIVVTRSAVFTGSAGGALHRGLEIFNYFGYPHILRVGKIMYDSRLQLKKIGIGAS